MNRLDEHLRALMDKDEKALILFITAGDPDIKHTLDIMSAIAHNGADVIEIGIPFSDPIADGPVIQRSTARALKNGIHSDQIFDLIASFRESHSTPVVLMGYLNPILHYGIEDFIGAVEHAGGDGLIVADLPYEEGETIEQICKSKNIHLIYLLAPEIDKDRTKKILKASSGFVYCVSHFGITGPSGQNEWNTGKVLSALRRMTDLPLAVGFGISSTDRARKACKSADGVIIGSWLIEELEKSKDKAKTAAQFTRRLKKSLCSDPAEL